VEPSHVGLLPPSEFIPLAEHRLMGPLTRQILELELALSHIRCGVTATR